MIEATRFVVLANGGTGRERESRIADDVGSRHRGAMTVARLVISEP